MIRNMPNKLKTLRMQYGLSQKTVAEILEISPSIVSSYETGERVPSLEKLKALASLYKCSADFLLGLENQKPTLYLDINDLSSEQVRVLQDLISVMKATNPDNNKKSAE